MDTRSRDVFNVNNHEGQDTGLGESDSLIHRKNNRFVWQENKDNCILRPETHNILITTSSAFENTLCGSPWTCPKGFVNWHNFKRKCRLYGTIFQKFSPEAGGKHSEIQNSIRAIETHCHITKVKRICYDKPICNFFQVAKKNIIIMYIYCKGV